MNKKILLTKSVV